MSRRLLCLSLLVFSTLPAMAQERPDSLKKYIEENEGRHAYGMYLAGKKMGWMVDDTKLGEYQNKPVAVLTSDGLLSIKLFGAESVMKFNAKYIYSLEGDGLLIYAEENESDDGVSTRRTATREGDNLVVRETSDDGFDKRREMPMSKDTLLEIWKFDEWLNGERKKGDRLTSFSLDLTDPKKIDDEETSVFQDRSERRWGGVPVTVTQVVTEMDGAKFNTSLLPDGSILNGTMGPMKVRLEEEAVAKDFETAVLDMTFEVTVDKDLGDAENVDRLVLRCTGLGDFELPASHRQSAKEDGRRAQLIEIKRDFKTGEKKPLTAEERQDHLVESASVPWKDERIQKLAKKIVGDETDIVKQADLLQEWVFNNLEATYSKNAATALKVLDNMAGDCTEHALLFIALARAADIPAREATGLMYANENGRQFFAWHAWAEVHDGEQWVSVDPAWDQTYVDATHILLSHSTDDLSWLQLLDNIRVKVVEFDVKSE